MIIQCKSCARKFVVKDNDIPNSGRTVKCGYCSVTWHQMPVKILNENKRKIKKPPVETKIEKVIDESPSIDSIKASDGKTYRFLGTQWAQVLPSGKTGLFARKKISRELDEVTGRKERKVSKRKQKKLEEVNPSSESLDYEKNLPEVYKSKEGIGFFGYIFLLIIIGFSLVGVLKTFEDDLLWYFPEMESIFKLFSEQLEFFAESVKNLIVIIDDLINSY